MFKGGSVWRPPPVNPYLHGMPDELVEKEFDVDQDSLPVLVGKKGSLTDRCVSVPGGWLDVDAGVSLGPGFMDQCLVGNHCLVNSMLAFLCGLLPRFAMVSATPL